MWDLIGLAAVALLLLVLHELRAAESDRSARTIARQRSRLADLPLVYLPPLER